MIFMNHFYSDVIQFKGNHYEFGYMQGELLKDSPLLYNRAKQRATGRKHQFNIHAQEAIDLFSKFIPRMLDELKGLADSLNWTMEEALTEFGGYYVEYENSGCSILTGLECMVRNYDSDTCDSRERVVRSH